MRNLTTIKKYFTIDSTAYYMEIGKTFANNELSWSIRYEADTPRADGDFYGEVEITFSNPDEIEFPVKAGIRNAGDHITFESENSEIEFNSNTTKKLNFYIQKTNSTEAQQSEKENDEKECRIWFTDSGKKGNDYSCSFVQQETISLSLQILDEETDEDKLKTQINDVYGTNRPAYTDLRQKSRFCTDFADHVEILDFLYKHTSPEKLDEDPEQEMFNFFKGRVIQGENSNKSYTSSSVSDLKEKIELCGSKSNLPNISYKDELIGLQYLKHTDSFVDAGEFGEAKKEISRAIDRFEKNESENLLPTKLKIDAIRGLHSESKCNFKKAASHYSNAAEKAADERNIQAYRAWSCVAKVKERLDQGEINEAQSRFNNIDYEIDYGQNIYLIDLHKLAELFAVYSKYTQGKQSDPATVFSEVEIKNKSALPTSDGVIQFNTDFSSAFTMLMTKQRRQQLGVDYEIDDNFHTIIRDAITPTGIEGNLNSEKQPKRGSTQQYQDDSIKAQSEDDFERNYTETKRVQRDSQFQEDLKEAYNQTCAVCGSERMTPDGRPEVEAAHIKPVSEGGKDVITNGIALCKLHHWAFDNSWISIDDDYTVTVKNVPDVSGYEDFAQYQGSRLNLPESNEHRPNKDVIEFHRHHHGFEDDG